MKVNRDRLPNIPNTNTQIAVWTMGRGDVSLRPHPISSVYNKANLIAQDA